MRRDECERCVHRCSITGITFDVSRITYHGTTHDTNTPRLSRSPSRPHPGGAHRVRRHPQRQHRSGAPSVISTALRPGSRRRSRRPGRSTCRSSRRGGTRSSSPQWLGAAGQADRAGLRPLRRAAARSAGEVGQPAVRADDPRRAPLRPRRVGRQGAAASRRSRRRRRSSPRRAACRSTSSSCSKAKRRSAAPAWSRSSRRTPICWPPISSSRPTAACGASTSRRVTISSRGLAGLEFTLTGAAKDLHSGRHGGAVANPLHAIAELVASLHAPDGRVAVAGFYDDVVELPPDRARGDRRSAVR